MSNTGLAVIFGVALVVVILLARFLKRRTSDGYHRRFVNGAPSQDTAFPYASTLYVGDGGSSSHSHHHHSADCAHSADTGGGCSDGGGGASGGN
jgi:uncharacterized membrane protein YgcG